MNLEKTCPKCNGLKYIDNDGEPSEFINHWRTKDCPECDGEGVVATEEGLFLLDFIHRHSVVFKDDIKRIL